jgi:NMT1-like family
VSSNLDRHLLPRAAARAHWMPVVRRTALVVVALALVGALLSQLNLKRDLHRLDTAMLSGTAEGSYHAIAQDLARLAAKENGMLREVASAGSIENVTRLRAARPSCDIAFALAQDGGDWGPPGELELIGRLPKAESVVLLGKDADKLTELSQLAHAKLGAGPEGSGAARLASQLFAIPELAALGVEISHRAAGEELAMLADGRLDLALVVIDEDAPWLGNTVRGGMQIAGLSHIDVVARRLPHFKTGRIGAGEFDAVRVIPAQDKRVLRVETLVLGNGCAGRSATIDLMTVLSQRFPDFVRHNKESANTTGLPVAAAARGFFEREGPELADEYVPWLVDVMPPTNWAYVVMAVSVLFNAMGAGHRFRLWRIDAARVALEAELATLFGSTTTLGDIARANPQEEAHALTQAPRVEEIVRELEALAARSRRYSLSVLVPMGQEMAYRYQEGVIYETLAVLRDFLRRAGISRAAATT